MELNNILIKKINKSLKRYKAEYDENNKVIEFEGNVYTVYTSIDYNENDNKFLINICHPVKLKGDEIDKFHKELHFTIKLVNKLNNLLSE